MLLTKVSIPTLEEIDRISAFEDPVIRNLQITQCYHELSTVLSERLGRNANWCTYATWASKQAGQTIRKEDLQRLLENRLKRSQATAKAAKKVALTAQSETDVRGRVLAAQVLNVRNLSPALDRASQAVGRGNKKVFDEIGREFARFFQACIRDETEDSEKIDSFCTELRPGDPPEGQRYLQKAFHHYYHAFFESDVSRRAALIFLANIEIGFHEQTRLQPEIAESLDAGLVSSTQFMQSIIMGLFPYSGWLILAHMYLMQRLGRPTALDLAVRGLYNDARILIRQTLTESMMAISFPNGVQIRLGEDLSAGFPDSLKVITNPELAELMARFDPTPDSLKDSGAQDWANLMERLHFIIDMFRCYQEDADLFLPPFEPEQVTRIRAGELPEGKL